MLKSELNKVWIESLSDNFDVLFEHYSQLLDALLFLIFNEEKTKEFENERLYHIDLLSQKFILHAHAVKNIIPGYNLNISSKQIPILDPSSVIILKRALIENYLTIDYLNERNNENLANIRFNIWMYQGLINRKIDDLKSLNAAKTKESDFESLRHFKAKIQESDIFCNLKKEDQIALFKNIKINWKIEFSNCCYKTVSWQTLLNSIGLKDKIGKDLYNFLSWHAHSQSISSLQLAEMYDTGMDKVNIKLSTQDLSVFTAFLINDLILLDKNINSYYKNLPDYQKQLILFYNHFYRDESFIFEKLEDKFF
jgi:hypothetical protein